MEIDVKFLNYIWNEKKQILLDTYDITEYQANLLLRMFCVSPEFDRELIKTSLSKMYLVKRVND